MHLGWFDPPRTGRSGAPCATQSRRCTTRRGTAAGLAIRPPHAPARGAPRGLAGPSVEPGKPARFTRQPAHAGLARSVRGTGAGPGDALACPRRVVHPADDGRCCCRALRGSEACRADLAGTWVAARTAASSGSDAAGGGRCHRGDAGLRLDVRSRHRTAQWSRARRCPAAQRDDPRAGVGVGCAWLDRTCADRAGLGGISTDQAGLVRHHAIAGCEHDGSAAARRRTRS